MNPPSQGSANSFRLKMIGAAVALTVGATVLIFQLVVIRIAMIWFGAEAETLAAIVCMSLVGLSGGAFVSGKTCQRNGNNPLQTLAVWLTVCAALQWLFWLSCEPIASFIEIGGWNLRVQKLVFAAVSTLPVNFFLGATLPLLTSASAQTNQKQSFAIIYAAETFGAASGAILAGFWLIPQMGLNIAQLVAVGLTVVSGTFAFLATRIPSTEVDVTVKPIPIDDKQNNSNWLLLFAVLLAGVSTMGIEIVWQRFFVLLFGSDTQSFAVVAATYLVGISLGSWLASVLIPFVTRLLPAYATTLAFVAATTVLATLALIKLTLDPTSFLYSNEWFSSHPVAYRLLTAATIMIVPTTLIGLALPLAVAFCTTSGNDAAPAVGKIYAATLVGNVCGLLGTGLFISSGNGLRMTVLLLSCFAVAAAVLLMISAMRSPTTSWIATAMATLAVLFWIPASMALSGSQLPLGVDLTDWNLDFYSEGKSSIVAVVSHKNAPDERRMVIDGVTIGESAGGVDEKQQMLAHLPFLIRKPDEKQYVLTIGLGTGILAGELAANAEVEELTCVELSSDVIEACQYFSDINGDVINNAKVAIENADGIRFLRKTNQEFDVIVSDAKSRPGHAGNVAFFARDYYELCNEKLTDRGVFVQWLSLETAFESVETIVASFSNVFRYGYVAVSAPDSLYLVGANAQLVFDPDRISAYLNETASLQSYGWHSPGDIASLYWLDQKSFEVSPRINRFDRPVLELFALRSSGVPPEVHKLANLQWLSDLLEDHIVSQTTEQTNGDADFLFSHRMAAIALIKAAIFMFERPDNWLDRAGTEAKAAFKTAPDLHRHQFVADLYRQLAAQAETREDTTTQFSALLNVSEMGLATAEEHFLLGAILNDRGESTQALDHMFDATRIEPNNIEYRVAFGFALLDAGKIGQAERTFQAVLDSEPNHPASLLGLGICKNVKRQRTDGQKLIQRALRAQPELQDLFRKYQDL